MSSKLIKELSLVIYHRQINQQLEKKLKDVVHRIACVLGSEKTYNIAAICEKYDLGHGSSYSGPNSKYTFIYNLVVLKDEQFIIDLAKRLVEDYGADSVGLALNHYYNGSYYKVSLISRQRLLDDLFSKDNLEGKLTADDFLDACGLKDYYKKSPDEFFAFLTGSPKDITLKEKLTSIRIQELLDKRFFAFLEQLVHPYTRNGDEQQNYVDLINSLLTNDGFGLMAEGDISGHPYYKVIGKSGVNEGVKNLIFAANGPKPEIVLADALSNRIAIKRNAEYCMVYDRPIQNTGLLWVDLVDWWTTFRGTQRSAEEAGMLKERLAASIASSPPEKVLFDVYYSKVVKLMGKALPALVPQVYLHYDPYSIKKFGIQYLLRQRMDFLLLLPGKARVVLEVDGKQHYSDGDQSSPKKYTEMVALDRELKLLGYEVYRFGGYELTPNNQQMILDFFAALFRKHGLIDRPV